MLTDRFEFFFARYGEAFGAVELGEFGEVGDEEFGADDAAFVGFYLVAINALNDELGSNLDGRVKINQSWCAPRSNRAVSGARWFDAILA